MLLSNLFILLIINCNGHMAIQWAGSNLNIIQLLIHDAMVPGPHGIELPGEATRVLWNGYWTAVNKDG